MGDHSIETSSTVRDAFVWLLANRRKVVSVAIVALPIVSRFVPGFPSDEILSVLRGFLGA